MGFEDNILDKLQESDLPEDMKYISKMLGFETAKLLMKYAGGTRLNIPMPQSYAKISLERHLENTDIELISEIQLSRQYNVGYSVVKRAISKRVNKTLF